jgi:hypothetical protein
MAIPAAEHTSQRNAEKVEASDYAAKLEHDLAISGTEHAAAENRSNAPAPSNAGDQVGRILQASVSEIDVLVSDLNQLRRRLMLDGERLQREVDKYAELTVASVSAVKIFGQTMVELRKLSAPPSLAPRGPARDATFEITDRRPLDVRKFAKD